MTSDYAIAKRARVEGREAYQFVIAVDVDPMRVLSEYQSATADVCELLQGEIESWLESLPYVHGLSVRLKV